MLFLLGPWLFLLLFWADITCSLLAGKTRSASVPVNGARSKVSLYRYFGFTGPSSSVGGRRDGSCVAGSSTGTGSGTSNSQKEWRGRLLSTFFFFFFTVRRFLFCGSAVPPIDASSRSNRTCFIPHWDSPLFSNSGRSCFTPHNFTSSGSSLSPESFSPKLSIGLAAAASSHDVSSSPPHPPQIRRHRPLPPTNPTDNRSSRGVPRRNRTPARRGPRPLP